MPKIKYKCDFCSTEILRYASTAKRRYCNKICKSEYQKTITGDKNPLTGRKGLFGTDNPNYGNKWSHDQKQVASDRSKTWHKNDDGSWLEKNRNRTWTDEGKDSLAAAVSARMMGVSRPHSTTSKLKIGLKSSEKFTPEYNQKVRALMEERGYWLPLNEKDPWELYRVSADWNERMFDLASDNECVLIEQYGIFHSTKNSKGVVRDHMYGRRYGFKEGVFPELLRHPANCQIILHADNIRKSKTNECSISLIELFDRIINYNNEWHEQMLCIELINLYKSGKRYSR